MSTVPTPQTPLTTPFGDRDREIRIYSHSSLFYWWPVWAVGFLMALLTLFAQDRMVVVPNDTHLMDRKADGSDQEVLELPPGKKYLPRDEGNNLSIRLLRHMSTNKNLGVLFATVLLVIIVISNVPLRGLWSVITILLIGLFVVILALAGWWDWLVDKIQLIDIRINLGGYIFISLALFIIWALTVFVFDRRMFLIVSSGQVRLHMAVGAGEDVYDTTGMTFQKRQDDLFRHWIVGIGSGDLIVNAPRANKEIDMPNVLFVGAKIREIERLIKEREVV